MHNLVCWDSIADSWALVESLLGEFRYITKIKYPEAPQPIESNPNKKSIIFIIKKCERKAIISTIGRSRYGNEILNLLQFPESHFNRKSLIFAIH